MYGIAFTYHIHDLLTPLTDRTKRIRDAKSEAQKEIEEYRKQKEEEFKKFEGEVRLAYLSQQAVVVFVSGSPNG
jgi:hypothetical protein